MRTKKFQPKGKRIMPETRFTEFPALSVDPRVGILGLHRRPIFNYFLTFDIYNYYLSVVISFIFDILRRIKTFSEHYSVFFVVKQNDVTSEI